MSTFQEDLLSRNSNVLQMASLIQNISGGASIALDAKWGAGKTFFVKQVKMVLDAFNDFTDVLPKEDKQAVKSVCVQKETNIDFEPMVTVYYDAWANDNDIDPMLSIVCSIISEANLVHKLEKGTDLIKIAGSIFELATGRGINSLIESIRGNDPLIKISETKEIKDKICEFLSSLLPERGNKLLVIVDELDRCRPSYAVQLLERIKHFFDCDSICFLFSVNLFELQHTIRHYYGNGFDASKYLNRFFDITISLPPANMEAYYRKIGLENGTWVFESVCKRVIDYYNFELREISRFYSLAKAVAYKPAHNNDRNMQFYYPDGKALQLSIICIIPIMIGLHLSDISKFDSFINGKDPTPFLQIFQSNDIAMGLFGSLLRKNESYKNTNNYDSIKEVKLEDKLKQVYEALFVHNYAISSAPIEIGDTSFTKNTREEILRIASGFSNYAYFGKSD